MQQKTIVDSNGSGTLDRHATRGQYLARTALTYRGLRYRWGGRSAQTGFDCSGLVQTIYAKWGLYLPRVASAQFRTGKPIGIIDLQPGDLVFFKNTCHRGLSHVGIYIGAQYFIHAAGLGKGVCMSRLDRGYHKLHWAGARRFDLSKLPPVPGEEKPIGSVIITDYDVGGAPLPNSGAPQSFTIPPSAPIPFTR